MRTRIAGYSDYEFKDEEVKEWNKKCQNADGGLELIMLQAAQESNEAIAADLFYSLRSGTSYDRIIDWNQIPINREDFYGYRRKTLFLIREKAQEPDADTLGHDCKDSYTKRFYTLNEACAELRIGRKSILNKAKEAEALLKIGSLYRVDMPKLYKALIQIS